MTISLTRKEIGIIEQELTTGIIAEKSMLTEELKNNEPERYIWYKERVETLYKILNKIVNNEKNINKQENFFEIIDNFTKKL